MFAKDTNFDWPLDTNIIRRSSNVNTFGMVRRKADGSPKPHQGWDLYAPEGTPCYAVADGVIVGVSSVGDYGNTVVLYVQKPKLYIAYSHLSEVHVKKGDVVKLGQPIAKTGKTGNASNMSGPDEHLHFEVRTMGVVGLGLEGRISPIQIFRNCPLAIPVTREKLNARTE